MMRISPDSDTAAEHCALFLAQLLEDAVHERGVAFLALSGGSSPQRMFSFLLPAALPWSAIHVFQVDERCVPPGHELSNYSMLERHLLQPAGVPPAHIHRMRGELPPAQAADLYASGLTALLGPHPHFDAIVCGVGPDAHTASLFPGDPLILDRHQLVASTFVPHFQQHRVTLLPRVLLHARNLLVLAPGAAKAPALTRVFDDRTPVLDAPAKLLFETSGALHWYLDEASAPH